VFILTEFDVEVKLNTERRLLITDYRKRATEKDKINTRDVVPRIVVIFLFYFCSIFREDTQYLYINENIIGIFE
jgi:hypothetical protein